MTYSVDGRVGHAITIRITEEIFAAPLADGPDSLRAWCQGKAFHLIPPEEELRRWRYEKDPIINGAPAGQFRKGVHYSELSTMRQLKNDGYQHWLYEGFELFRLPPKNQKSETADRTRKAGEALGPDVLEELREAANLYRHEAQARVPDLMAWRSDGTVQRFRFVESKNLSYNEPVKPGQLLGLALLALIVPNADVHIYRWLEQGSYQVRLRRGALNAKAHERMFLPGTPAAVSR